MPSESKHTQKPDYPLCLKAQLLPIYPHGQTASRQELVLTIWIIKKKLKYVWLVVFKQEGEYNCCRDFHQRVHFKFRDCIWITWKLTQVVPSTPCWCLRFQLPFVKLQRSALAMWQLDEQTLEPDHPQAALRALVFSPEMGTVIIPTSKGCWEIRHM